MYGKHFAQMYSGSMVGCGPLIFAVWGYIIANANKDSTIEINPVIAGAQIGCSADDINTALDFLQLPDENSRTPDEGGCRLVKLDNFSYHVVTYAKYSSIKKDDDRRAYMRDYMAQRRAEKKAKINNVNSVNVNGKQALTVLTHIDRDIDRDKDITKNPLTPKGDDKGSAKVVALNPTQEAQRIDIGSWFGRRESTQWSAKEIKALRALNLRLDGEFDLVRRFYSQAFNGAKPGKGGQGDYRRRDVSTLLNNWQGETDRARAFFEETSTQQDRPF